MNVLLLQKGCQASSYVRAALDMDKAEDAGFEGKGGERICLFYSYNPECTNLFAQRFGMSRVTPILKKSDGTEITDIDGIIAFFNKTGYAGVQ